MVNPLQIDHYVAGIWRDGVASSVLLNPSDLSDAVAHTSEAGAPLVEEAMAAAASAQPLWARSSLMERSNLLMRISRDLEGIRNRLASELSREEGKLLGDARAEAGKAVEVFRYYAGLVINLDGAYGRRLGSDAEVIVSRDPRGVVGLITPWNAPLAIVAWKLAPALAMGNAVVLKPSERAPVSVQSMIRVIVAAMEDLGVPAGVLNVVNGAAETGGALAAQPGLDALSFTGGVGAGKALAAMAAERLLPLQLELGGKNAMIVARDADIGRAVALTVAGGFAGAGQKCTATSRVIVEAPIADAFLDALSTKVATLTTGRADADVFMGPVIDAAAVARTDKAAHAGACLAQGKVEAENGHFAAACLILDDNPQSALNQTEQFAPVVSVMRVPDLDAAISAANATPFGLSSAIVTNNLSAAHAFRRVSRAGIVAVNQTTSGSDLHAPFEGSGRSGLGGPEQGREALTFFSRTKTAYILND